MAGYLIFDIIEPLYALVLAGRLAAICVVIALTFVADAVTVWTWSRTQFRMGGKTRQVISDLSQLS